MTEPTPHVEEQWLTPGVAGIGAASLLSDAGHEIPTSLLPSLLTSTLQAPAAALGIIEGVADGLAGLAKLAGGALADDPVRRRQVAVGGYVATAGLSAGIAAATSVWQVGVLRAGAWLARGLRVPSRNALLADSVAATAYGRAYGFERAMDNLGAILGPLLALGLVALVGVRSAIALSVIPGVLAAGAIVYAIRRTRGSEKRERSKVRLRLGSVLKGQLGRLLGAVAAFEVGNAAATLLILRASEQLTPSYGVDRATTISLALYTTYNLAATLISVPAGRWADRLGRRGPVLVLTAGTACFVLAYGGLTVSTTTVALLAVPFVLAGVGIGAAETAEHAAVASLAPAEVRGSAFGVLAAVQSAGNVAASAVAGILWTVFSPSVAFTYLAVSMLLALLGLADTARRMGRPGAAP